MSDERACFVACLMALLFSRECFTVDEREFEVFRIGVKNCWRLPPFCWVWACAAGLCTEDGRICDVILQKLD